MTTTMTGPAATLAALRALTEEVSGLLDTIGPDQWEAATPCPGLDVREAVEHLIAGLRAFTRVALGEGAPDFTSEPVAAADAVRAHRAAAAAAAQVWSVPGRLEAEFTMPWGPSTGAMLVGFLVLEQAGHGWDVARGVGRPVEFDRAAVTVADGAARAMMSPGMRTPGMFGPEVPAPAGATPLDRLAAFLGRQP